MSAKEITVSFDYSLAGSIEDVYSYLASPMNDEEWQSSCDKVTMKVPDELVQKGTQYIIHFSFLSRKMNFEAEVSEFEALKSYGYRTLSGPIRYEGIYHFEPKGGEVKVHWVFKAIPGKFFGIIPHSLIRKTLVKRIGEDIERLKENFARKQQLQRVV